jgi:hypothetical protein
LATVAAPYLVTLPGFSLSMINGSYGLTDFLFGIWVATGALMFFGIPVLILAGICAAILHRLKLQTRGWCMLGGAGVGLGFLGLIQLLPGTTMNIGFWPLVLVVLETLLPGALCGWIYWRIAIGRTPEGPRAIEAE